MMSLLTKQFALKKEEEVVISKPIEKLYSKEMCTQIRKELESQKDFPMPESDDKEMEKLGSYSMTDTLSRLNFRTKKIWK